MKPSAWRAGGPHARHLVAFGPQPPNQHRRLDASRRLSCSPAFRYSRVHMVDELVSTVREALQERADPVRAPQAQAYMKSAMPYLGVTMPILHKVCAELFVR